MVEKDFHISKVGKITLVKNKRSKRFKLRVKPDKQVVVTLPYYSSFKSALKFASEHAAWIIKQQNRFDSGLTKFEINSTYDTKTKTIHLLSTQKEKLNIKEEKNNIYVYFPEGYAIESEVGQSFINDLITNIYRREAKEYLPRRLQLLADKFAYSYNRAVIKNNKTNWGSCSSKNNINLNLHLMKLPFYLIDYILLHELVHTKIKNHSPEFHAELDRLVGGKSKELNKEVKKYSTYKF